MIDEQEKIETYDVYIIKQEATEPVVDSVPTHARRSQTIITIVIMASCLLLIGTLVIIPPATTTQQLSIVHSLTLPTQAISLVTLRETLTIPTTGKGHTDATHAKGVLVFYNGSFQPQSIPQNMIFTAANGVQVVTDEAITIPAGSPPNYGVATVSAHALQTGTKGNIPAYAIDTACCALSVKTVNTDSFSGGRNARDYHVVKQSDIDNVVTTVVTSLYRQEQTALQSGLTRDDILIPVPCTSATSASRHVGEEAASVTVTVTESCSAIAYSLRALREKAQQLIHIPVGFMLKSVEIHVISTSLVGSQKSVSISISVTVCYSGMTREGWVK